MVDDEDFLMGEDDVEADPAPRRTKYKRAHRGGTILTLGIVGLLCCFIAGIIAWVMAAEDLKRMDRGEMDPDGRGTTHAGMILGIISVAYQVLGAIFAGATGWRPEGF